MLIPSRESLLAAIVATTTLLPNFTQADQPEPSLFRNGPAAHARPIRDAAQPADAQWAEVRKRHIGSSSTTLRWQTPLIASQVEPIMPTKSAAPAKSAAPVQAVSHAEPEPAAFAPVSAKPMQVANKVLVWGQDGTREKGSQVRLVTQLGPIDPFDDPFGDRGTQSEEPRSRTLIAQPDNSQRAAQPQPPIAPDPPAPQSESEFSPFQDEVPRPTPRDDLSPQPAPIELPPPATDNRPFRNPVIPRSQPDSSPAECEKVYNERNCCTEGEECQHARQRVRENTIDRISLNISPSFKPDAANQAEVEQARMSRLAQSDFRSWRNRDGEIVARGQVTDLQFGRIYVQENGKVAKIPVRELSDDDWCFLAAWWGVPTECSLGDDKFEQREWLASTMTWKASGVCHKPLYFEEVQLERYGHTAGPVLQPALSGAHFFLNIAALPYQMGISPPNECEYPLGYYRPGSCAPWLLPPIPLSVRGGLMEAGAIVGGVFVIP